MCLPIIALVVMTFFILVIALYHTFVLFLKVIFHMLKTFVIGWQSNNKHPT